MTNGQAGGSGSCGAVVWESTDNLSKSLSGWGGLGVKGGGRNLDVEDGCVPLCPLGPLLHKGI